MRNRFFKQARKLDWLALCALLALLGIWLGGSPTPASVTFAAAPSGKPEAAPNSPTLSNVIYLPLVMKPAVAGMGLVNGTFESGNTGWMVYSKYNRTVIRTNFAPGVSAHSGSWAAWLGGLLNETTYIQQQVTVSGSNPYLAYWHWVASADNCGYDFGYVRVNGTAVDTLNLCASSSTNGWVRRIVNLGAYVGQSVTLQIRATTDITRNSNWFIDDVGFQSSPNGVELFEPALLNATQASATDGGR